MFSEYLGFEDAQVGNFLDATFILHRKPSRVSLV